MRCCSGSPSRTKSEDRRKTLAGWLCSTLKDRGRWKAACTGFCNVTRSYIHSHSICCIMLTGSSEKLCADSSLNLPPTTFHEPPPCIQMSHPFIHKVHSARLRLIAPYCGSAQSSSSRSDSNELCTEIVDVLYRVSVILIEKLAMIRYGHSAKFEAHISFIDDKANRNFTPPD
jgi:hypothetical protein